MMPASSSGESRISPTPTHKLIRQPLRVQSEKPWGTIVKGLMHILHVVGARPNFMKAAPVLRALGKDDAVPQTLVHTGQHYDKNLSDIFFSQLSMPAPDVNLEVGSGSHAWQTAEVMKRLEPVILERNPDVVLVYGD